MARKLRVEYPGAIYHVMNRGDRREAIFVDDLDRQLLMESLPEACEKTDWQIHAWCLMRNHFHLVRKPRPSESSEKNLSGLDGICKTWSDSASLFALPQTQ